VPSPPSAQYLTREAMEKAGLPTPRNARINAPEDVEPAGEHVGFPAVIKPVSGGGVYGLLAGHMRGCAAEPCFLWP
jgi:carbamoylphosphate synthase large subunit